MFRYITIIALLLAVGCSDYRITTTSPNDVVEYNGGDVIDEVSDTGDNEIEDTSSDAPEYSCQLMLFWDLNELYPETTYDTIRLSYETGTTVEEARDEDEWQRYYATYDTLPDHVITLLGTHLGPSDSPAVLPNSFIRFQFEADNDGVQNSGDEVLARSADGLVGQENVIWQYLNADGTEVLDHNEIAVTTYSDMYSEVAIPSCVM